MNCANHPEIPAVSYCRTCGKAMCQACQRVTQGAVYCEEHALPASAAPGTQPPPLSDSPYTAAVPPVQPDAGASPGLAFLLGLIPGVGAIYNGQYVKGLIHVVILGVLISIVSSDAAGGFEPLFGMLIGVWVFYMAFEAYHTAKKRQAGQPVDEFSSLIGSHAGPHAFPAGPVVLIAVGILFLLHTLNVIRIGQLLRYWPLGLIALGAYLLYERIGPAEHPHVGAQEVGRER
jgi:TM2 domain-containing membrane protein YozV